MSIVEIVDAVLTDYISKNSHVKNEVTSISQILDADINARNITKRKIEAKLEEF